MALRMASFASVLGSFGAGVGGGAGALAAAGRRAALPNSRVLMFFRDTQGESGGPQLWSVDITGYNEQRVPIQGFASDPAWSPKLN